MFVDELILFFQIYPSVVIVNVVKKYRDRNVTPIEYFHERIQNIQYFVNYDDLSLFIFVWVIMRWRAQ